MNRLSTTSAIGDLAPHGFDAAGRADSTAVFHRARRHSRKVRALRVAIPVILVVGVLGLVLSTWFDPLRVLYRLPTDGGSLVISGTKIIMAQPKLSGYTKDSRRYELNAAAAAQDITKPDIVELQNIRATVEAQDKSLTNVTAHDGVFHRKTGMLTLNRDVVVTAPNYQLRLIEAFVDTGSGNIVSEKPVEVTLEQGTVTSKRFEVIQGGEVIRFEGDVVMKLTFGEPGDAKAAKP
jgi:lipopolysaccharide export system protein LptC